MVIAHVLSSFEIGGQEVMAVELASRQVARGHRVLAFSLATARAGVLESAFVQGGVKAIHVPKMGPRFDPSLPLRLAFAFRRHSVEIVHVHNLLPLIYGATAGKLARCAVVATRHGLTEGAGRKLWLRRQTARLVDRYVAVSKQVADNTRSHKVATEPKLVVLENGIDLARYQPKPDVRAAVRAELRLPEQALVMGTVCRLADYKNVGLLVRTALPHLGPETWLLIVGDGPERAGLEALAGTHPHGEFVRFLGQRSDVVRLLNALDLFVLSSNTEGHPIAVIEAMATGLPVLATAVGGIPDMVEDGTTGFLAAVDDASFAARFRDALAERRRWAAMGQAARAAALSRYSSETMADRYQDLYEDIKRARRC